MRVQRVDERPEVVGRAVARGGRVVPGDLVAPRPAVGVLGHRQQLHVGEAQRSHVRGKRLRDLGVPDGAVGTRAPRPQMHLVDGEAVGTGGERARRAIQSSSRQRCSQSVSTLVWVCGSVAARASGSARCTRPPSGPASEKRYREPGSTPATLPSQTPWSLSRCSGSWSSDQPFQSPMTETDRACGAQTPKRAPPSVGRAPSTSQSRVDPPRVKSARTRALSALRSGPPVAPVIGRRAARESPPAECPRTRDGAQARTRPRRPPSPPRRSG